jgi:hypothetical protein
MAIKKVISPKYMMGASSSPVANSVGACFQKEQVLGSNSRMLMRWAEAIFLSGLPSYRYWTKIQCEISLLGLWRQEKSMTPVHTRVCVTQSPSAVCFI